MPKPTPEQRAEWGRQGALKLRDSRTADERSAAARQRYLARPDSWKKSWAAKGGRVASSRMGEDARRTRSQNAGRISAATSSPEQRSHRAREAALRRHHPDGYHPPTEPSRCACGALAIIREQCDDCFCRDFHPPRYYLGALQ